jgi:diguanylate cyclase (GGDEF)-like protein/PAS domain S-box-containing protein
LSVPETFGVGSESFVALVSRAVRSFVWTTDDQLVIRSSQGSYLEARGRPPGAANGMHLRDYLRPVVDADAILLAHRDALAGAEVALEILIKSRFLRLYLAPLRAASGEIVGVSGIAVDATSERQMLSEVQRSQEALQLAQSAARLGSWTHDLGSDTVAWSGEMFAICALPADHVPTAATLRELVHPDDRAALDAALEVAREERTSFAIDTRLIRADGTERWVAHRGRYSFGERGVERVIGTVLDIDARKRAEEHLAFQANHDALTGLPNSKLLTDRINFEILRGQTDDSQFAVIFVDLDRFKQINDTLGSEIGDEFLGIVATRLAQNVRDCDIVGRVGADAFLIVVPGISSVREPAAVSERIVAAFQHPIELGSRSLYSSASVGISLYPEDGETASALIRAADTARLRNAGDGRGTYRFYAASTHARAIDRLDLEQGLFRAFERGEFMLNYQPIVDRFERPVAVEALLRWESPERGLVMPDRFIPLCEEIGLIVPLGKWVMRRALEQLAQWRTEGLAPLRLALNISGRQMIDTNFVVALAEAIVDTGTTPALIELELTESVIMSDLPAARRMIAELKSLGVRISLDDFGTGYSTLAYLKHFAADALKIDRAFVRDLPHDRGDSAIVSAVVALGHAMGLSVVAEGVETAEQAALVRRLGCDEMQGYHFAAPLSADRVASVVRAWSIVEIGAAVPPIPPGPGLPGP